MTSTVPSPLLSVLRRHPAWPGAVAALAALNTGKQAAAAQGATGYASVYQTERAAMVFDVVASRQRNYVKKVEAVLVPQFRLAWPHQTLAGLVASSPYAGISLSGDEWTTVVEVVAAFGQYGAARRVTGGDDAVVRAWAEEVEPVRLSPRLDPFVGSVKGALLT